MRRRVGVLTAVLSAAILLAGCSGGVTRPTGVVTGSVELYGGPPSVNFSPRPASGSVVTLNGPEGASYITTGAADGTFSIRVPSGTYTVTGTNGNTQVPTCTGGSVTVVAGRTVTVQVGCAVP